MRNKMLKRGAAVAVTALAAMAVGTNAFAHTAMREATPADGSTIDALPEEVSVLLSGILTEGSIQLFDPCGKPIAGETEYTAISPRAGQPEAPGSRLTATAASTKTGNYQGIWTGVGTDTHEVSGLWTFDVKNGEACAKVSRDDGEDNANGIDVTGVATKRSGKKKLIVSVSTADAVKGSTLAAKISDDAEGNVLDLVFENEQDKEADFRGRFVGAGKKIELLLGSNDLKTKYGRYTVKAKGDTLSVKLPAKLLRPEVGKHVDVYAESQGNTEDCGETGCLDIAPDLGYLRALSR